MSSLARRYAVRFALGSALLASACERDSNADFDEGGLMSPDTGGSGASDAGGSDAAAGVDSGGSSASGTASGGKAGGGDSSQGGKANAGAGGVATVGGKGGSSNGGKAGTDAGGAPPQAGKAGVGGLAGSATAGSGGTVGTPPEPVTFETTDIDDTYVASCFPSMNYGALLSMNVDGDGDGSDSCTYQILIIAPLSGLPAGALVSEATLTLTCTNAGDPITVSYVNEAWKELMVRYNTRPEVGASLGTVTCAQQGQEVTINLTSAVKAWLAGDHAAHGIYLRTEDSDGTDFATSEALSTSTRPAFRVTYTLPVK